MLNLRYLPQPGMSSGYGIGSAAAAVGKTMQNLGQLPLDAKAKADAKGYKDANLKLLNNQDARSAQELKLKQDAFDYKMQKIQKDALDAAIKAGNKVGAFRKAHPKATANLSDSELLAWGDQMDKLLPKDKSVKISKIDARITPDGHKIMTYVQNGNIVEKDLGPVKTDWNTKKASSDIPKGWVNVGSDFYNQYADTANGLVKSTKDGRFIAPISFVNAKQAEQIGNSKKLLDTPLQ
ncbi:MAG: hypothetical protein R3331_09280 [Sulfurospirillaceae bacterium]|nr:hypothetical protein [Sulfurospirillaceae bacterium]